MTNRKSRTRFRLVPKSTTLNDREGYYAVAALAIDKAGPIGPTIFVRALPRALPLGQEAKKVVSTEIFNMFNHMTFACYI